MTDASPSLPLRVCSYASDASDGVSTWTLFIRQQPTDDGDTSAFVFTVLVATTRENCVVYEQRLDRDAMEQHIEELGIEVKVPAFTDLLLKTLAVRKSVNVAIDDEDDSVVRVLLTYKFSETISRKGQIELACVSKTVPLAIATLLQDVHMVPNEPVLTESQKIRKQTAAQVKAKTTAPSVSMSLSLSQDSNQSQDGETAVAPVSTTSAANAQLLKRRHVPTGTVRRKGPRGAKLAKIE